MPDSGDVVLAYVQFTDTLEVKKRPALVLFSEFCNVVVAGITSNRKMGGIPLTRKEGAIKESVIKLNYIFTISDVLIAKVLFRIGKDKKQTVYQALVKRLEQLRA